MDPRLDRKLDCSLIFTKICFNGWSLLVFFSCLKCIVTPSSKIYLSNGNTELNMQRKATIMGFNLLGDVKEVESTKTHPYTFHIINKTSNIHPNHSANHPPRPTQVLVHQAPVHSLDMNQNASKRLETLPQQGQARI